MNEEQISQYKTILEDELTSLTETLEEIATLDKSTNDWVAVPTVDSTSADENIEADGVEEWNERRATVGQLETRYRNVQRALHKITEGSFGVCEISGKEIEQTRLEANPAARTSLEHIDRETELPL